MKKMVMFISCFFILAAAGCGNVQTDDTTGMNVERQSEEQHPEKPQSEEQMETEAKQPLETQKEESETQMIYARIGEHTLAILPENNSSAEALTKLLKESDITVEMREYGGFEKVGSLGSTLPVNDERITTKAGDVILYQGKQITIYYDKNTWNFTRLGRVQNVSTEELRDILGDGDVTVTFSLEK